MNKTLFLIALSLHSKHILGKWKRDVKRQNKKSEVDVSHQNYVGLSGRDLLQTAEAVLVVSKNLKW